MRDVTAIGRGGLRVGSVAVACVLAASALAASAGGSAARNDPSVAARYLRMRDGVRIAVDVWLPASRTGRLPTLVRSTRYWRAWQFADPRHPDVNLAEARTVTAAGYALVLVDVRGTGASFGRWPYPWSRAEVEDLGQVADWIARQPWSNGRIGAYGISYEGGTAELLGSLARPAVKAVAPLFDPFDPYADLAFPGGIRDDWFLRTWRNLTVTLDADGTFGLSLPADVTGVKPVDGGRGKALLHDAVVQHGQNGDVYDAAKRVVFRDDPFAGGKIAIWSPSTYVRRLAASSTAVYAQASWLDAGTATGALSRFASSHNPQQLVIGPWNHGGSQDADPFRAADEPAQPTATQQFHDLLAFFDATVKRDADRTRTIRYYTLDGGGWHTTTTWPPNGTTHRTWYLLAHGGLATTRPRGRAGADRYRVDFTASSGPTNRWHTDATGGDVVYPDRASQDRKLLTYTSAPLAAATDITGAPVVTLQLRSTATDGAFFVYLEDVAPNGRVTYVTEGELRALDRKISRRAAPYHVFGPYRSYMRSDGAPLVPGRTAELRFTLQPTSVVFPKGHRLRVAIAGADRGTFARVPATGRPVITVLHNSIDASRIELPYNVDIPT